MAVERTQPLADIAKINKPVDRSQHVIGRHMPLETEAVKQRFLRPSPLAHHRAAPPPLVPATESDHHHRGKRDFFNGINNIADIKQPCLSPLSRALIGQDIGDNA